MTSSRSARSVVLVGRVVMARGSGGDGRAAGRAGGLGGVTGGGGVSVHAAGPLGVVLAHASLVVDRVVLEAAVEDVERLGALAHGLALEDDAQEVLGQVAAEGAPDGVVVAD